MRNFWGWAGAGSLALACVSGDPGLETASEYWCEGGCRAFRRCGDSQSQDDCRRSCAAQNPQLNEVSLRGAELLGQCVATLGCDVIASDSAFSAAQGACWDEARSRIEPTPRVRQFCGEYSRTVYECGGWVATEECESVFAMWGAQMLDNLGICMTRSTCEAFDQCVEATFGDS